MPRILVVCTANICRSPLVQAYLRRELEKRGLTDWEVASAGTWATFERGAARYSQKIARNQGLDLSDHRSRMVTHEMLRQADVVLGMTSNHIEALRAEFPDQASKLFMLSQLVGRRYDISDPYGGPEAGYVEMSRAVEQIITRGIDRLIELVDAPVTE